MRKKIVLALLILLLVVGIVLFFTKSGSGKYHIFKRNNVVYKEYSAGDKIELDTSDWYVLYDSSSEDDYVTLISGVIEYNEEIPYVLDNIYEISDLKKYLENDYANSLGLELEEVNGYKIRLLDMDDIKKLDYEYDSSSDTYTINDCPQYICFLNNFSATMIDTKNDNVENPYDVVDQDEYEYKLKYYNLESDYDSNKLVSSTDDVTLFLRPIINVKKSSLGE